MSLQEIKNIPIAEIANIGCQVYCWTTSKLLEQTFDVLKSWGVN
jgi:N6-adenosine-specific RNA methylase IME4